MNDALGIWLVRPQARDIGALVQSCLGGALYLPGPDAREAQKDRFALCYRAHRQWVLVAASGIAVRFLAGLVQDKVQDPAVVVLDEAARHAIALLGGHEGGANRLAYRVADAVGAVPVITTATEALKPLSVGIGCRRNASVDAIEAAVRHALQGRTLGEVREVATVDLKAREPGLLAFCERHDLPLRVFSREALAARPMTTRPSSWVRQTIGLDGVCEPCALLTCARGGLVVPKTTWNGVAVAVAEDRCLR